MTQIQFITLFCHFLGNCRVLSCQGYFPGSDLGKPLFSWRICIVPLGAPPVLVPVAAVSHARVSFRTRVRSGALRPFFPPIAPLCPTPLSATLMFCHPLRTQGHPNFCLYFFDSKFHSFLPRTSMSVAHSWPNWLIRVNRSFWDKRDGWHILVILNIFWILDINKSN